MKNWLTEDLYYSQLLELDEKKSPLPKGVIMQARAKVAHAGKVTANARLYGRKLVKREVDKLKEKISQRPGSVLGETDHPHPTEGSPSVRRVGIIFTEVTMKPNGEVLAEFNIPDTAAGKDLAALARAGAEVGFSSRARGNVREVTMDDQHPDFELNQDWAGKKVNEVADDFDLSTFDAVIGQAVDDATLQSFHEQNTEGTMFDLSKLTPQDWKQILEAEQVKKHIEETVKAAVEKNQKELEEQFEKQVTAAIKEHMLSDEFAGLFLVEGTEGDPAPVVAEAKCAECGAAVAKGAKFCPECGRKVSVPAPAKAESEEAKDKRIAEQDSKIAELTKKQNEMEDRERERQEADVVAEAIESALLGKPKEIIEGVEKALEDVELTPANVKDLVVKKLTLVESLAKPIPGGNSKATGVVIPNDKDKPLNEGKESDDPDMKLLNQIG